MKKHHTAETTATLLGALLLMISLAGHADVFKCTAADGSVLLTNSPCDKSAHSETIPEQRLQPGMLISAHAGTAPVASTPPPAPTQKKEESSSLLQSFLDIVHQFSQYADQVLGNSKADPKNGKL